MSENQSTESKNIYWFYKWPLWLRVLLCIFLLPVFIPILVWPKLKMPVWGKIAILIVWIVVMLGISGSSSASEDNKDIVLNVTGISENEVRKNDKLSLKIKTDPITVDEVTINGESATKKGFDSEYSLEKTFPEGENEITVIAKKGNKKTEKVFSFKIDLSERKQIEEDKKNEFPAQANNPKDEVKSDNVPAEYKSALNKANSYANIMNMSKKGVYDQLVSQYGEKFSVPAAQYAIDNVQADWNKNALAKAKSYQETLNMSPSAIRDQLVSQYGEKFTSAEADYAIANLNK